MFFKYFDFILNNFCKNPKFEIAVKRLFSSFNPEFFNKINNQILRLDRDQETIWIAESTEKVTHPKQNSNKNQTNLEESDSSFETCNNVQNLNLIELMIKKYLRELRRKLKKETPDKAYDESLNWFYKTLCNDEWNDARFLLIDCRFEYEFHGGHIRGSFNVNDPAVIKTLFFSREWQKLQKYFDFLNLYRDSVIDLELAEEIVSKFENRLELEKIQSQSQSQNPQNLNKGEKKLNELSKQNITKILKRDLIRLRKIKQNTKNLSGKKFLELIKAKDNIIKIANEMEIDLMELFKNEKQMNKFFMKHETEKIAINLSNRENEPENQEQTVIFVFLCEFSSERGPRMCNFFRSCDRKTNEYPNLTFPLNYLMKGGYSEFHKNYKYFCTPKVAGQNSERDKRGAQPENYFPSQPMLENNLNSFSNLNILSEKVTKSENQSKEFQKMDQDFENLLKTVSTKNEKESNTANNLKTQKETPTESDFAQTMGSNQKPEKSGAFLSDQRMFSQNQTNPQPEIDFGSISNFANNLGQIIQKRGKLHYLNPNKKGGNPHEQRNDTKNLSIEDWDGKSLDSSRYRRMEDVNFVSEFSNAKRLSRSYWMNIKS